MGYNYNKGKFYDASGTRAFCDAMNQAVADYEQYAIDTKTAYIDFDVNKQFNGITALALKMLILNGAGSLLKEVTDLHKQMINDQNYLMANFEETVDANQRARIENDTLELINKDFQGYYKSFVSHATGVKSLVDTLNSEFGSYAYFKQPNKDGAVNGFKTICGGEGEGGYIIGCRDIFLEYDYRMTKYLKGRDTADRSLNLLTRITDTAAFLGGQTYAKPEVTDTKIQELEEAELESGVAGFTATIEGWFNNMRTGLEKHLDTAKQIGTKALEGLEKFQDDFYIGSFEALESMDNSVAKTIVGSDFYAGFKKIVEDNIIEEFYYKNPFINSQKAGLQTLTLVGKELDKGLKWVGDKLVDLQPDSPWYYRITNMGFFRIFEIGGAIQSIIENGDLSEMDKNSVENFNAFQRGAWNGVVEMVTGLFSLPELIANGAEGAVDNLGDLANYLTTHEVSEIPGDLEAWFGEKKQQAKDLWKYFTDEFKKKYYNEDGSLKVTAWYESAGYIVAFIASCFIGSGEANSATKGGAALNSVDDVARGLANVSDDAVRVAGGLTDDAARVADAAAGTLDDVARGVAGLEDDALRVAGGLSDDVARTAGSTTDDVARITEEASKMADDAVKTAEGLTDDVAKAAGSATDDVAKITEEASKMADDAVKTAEGVTDDVAKAAGSATDDVAKVTEDASKVADDAVKAVDDKLDDVAKVADDAADDTSKVLDDLAKEPPKKTYTVDDFKTEMEELPRPDIDDLTKENILKTEKEFRLDPKEYLSPEEIEKHLKMFDDGVVKIQSRESLDSAIANWGDTLGHSSGNFVMPKDVAVKAIEASDGNPRVLEELLGLNPGTLGDNPVIVEFTKPSNLRIPSGKEIGANEFWLPGGYTSGGIPEAVIDPSPLGTYVVEDVSKVADDIARTAEEASKVGTDVSKVVGDASKAADKAVKTVEGVADDATKAAEGAVKDVSEAAEDASKMADKTVKTVEDASDDALKAIDDGLGKSKPILYDKSTLKTLENTDNFTDSAIEHIFEGNVKKGQAGGYHYECIENTAGSVIPGTEVPVNDYGVYKAQVTVKGIDKTANGGYSTFFPKDMSPQEVIDAINEAYATKVHQVRNVYIGYTNDGMEITIYINKECKIISAFPTGGGG